jgi:hypothetical protein
MAGGSGALNPIQNPQSWDNFLIGQTLSPGIIPIGGITFKRKHEWDIKKGKGTTGGTVTFVGRPPAEGTIRIQLWSPQTFADWANFLPLLKYDPSKKAPQAVDIYHPALADVDINSVVIEEIGIVEHVGNQLYEVELSFIEYFPPPKASAVGTPTGSVTPPGTTPGTPPPAAQDAEQQEIAALLAKAQAP